MFVVVDMDVISFSYSSAFRLYPHCKVDIMLMGICSSIFSFPSAG